VQAVGDQADKVEEYLHRSDRGRHEHPTAPREAGHSDTSGGKPDKAGER